MASKAPCNVGNMSPKIPSANPHLPPAPPTTCPSPLTSGLGTLCCHLVGHGDRDLGGAGVRPPGGSAGWGVSVQAVGDHPGGGCQEERGESSGVGPWEGGQDGEGNLGTPRGKGSQRHPVAALSRRACLGWACLPRNQPTPPRPGGLS